MDDVDDGPEAGLGHGPHEAADHVPGAVEVEVDHRAPAVVRDLRWQRRELAAGVVDEEVDPTELVVDALLQRVDLIGLPDVGRDGEAATSQRTDGDRGVLERLGGPAGHHQVGPVAGEGERRRPADAGAAAGHERDPSAKSSAANMSSGPKPGGSVIGAHVTHRCRRSTERRRPAGALLLGGQPAASGVLVQPASQRGQG